MKTRRFKNWALAAICMITASMAVSSPALADKGDPDALGFIQGVTISEVEGRPASALVQVYNADGDLIHEQLSGTDGTFSSDDLTPGTYFIYVTDPACQTGFVYKVEVEAYQTTEVTAWIQDCFG